MPHFVERLGGKPDGLPLRWYRTTPFCANAFERFGTPLEQRLSRREIASISVRCGAGANAVFEVVADFVCESAASSVEASCRAPHLHQLGPNFELHPSMVVEAYNIVAIKGGPFVDLIEQADPDGFD